jgi:hypothetical protein
LGPEYGGQAVTMWKRILLIVTMAAAVPCAAAAQELASYQSDSCRKFANMAEASSRDLLYARAACVAARAGVTSPENGPLSQEELLSILMLMSLPKTPAAAHASS